MLAFNLSYHYCPICSKGNLDLFFSSDMENQRVCPTCEKAMWEAETKDSLYYDVFGEPLPF